MNWNQIEGNWKQLKGNLKQKWEKLSDDELDVKVSKKRKPAAGKNQHTRNNIKDDVDN